MRAALFLALAACVACVGLPAASATNVLGPCSYKASTGAYYDFSALAGQGTTIKGTQSDVYSIDICGATNVDPVCTNADAAVCLQFTWSPDWFALARSVDAAGPTPTFSEITPGQPEQGILLTYTNGAYGPNQATVDVQLLCTNDTTPVYTAEHQSAYNWLVIVSAASNCPSSGPLPPPPPAPIGCSYTFSDGQYFDFEPLSLSQGVQVNGVQSDVYWLNPCGVVTLNPTCEQGNATLCFQFTWSPDIFTLAADSTTQPPTWSQIPPTAGNEGGVQLLYTNGVYGPNPATVAMQFLCTNWTGPAQYTAQHDSAYHWTVTISSSLACPQAPPSPPSPSGLACGWTAPDGAKFDFTSLYRAYGGVQLNNDSAVFVVNPCGVATAAPVCSENNATVCMQWTWSPDWFAIADWSAAAPAPGYSEVVPGDSSQGIMLSFQNGYYGSNVAQVDMIFRCGAGETTYGVSQIINTLHWVVEITSPAACRINQEEDEEEEQPAEESIALF